jgi:uncharacterized repeat protein (TIGR01451 family)
MGHKILLFCFLLFTSIRISAQAQTELDVALNHLNENIEQLGLEQSDLEDLVLSSQYTHDLSGCTYIYLNQSYNGIKVKNAMINVTINVKGEVIHSANSFVPNLASRIQSTEAQIRPAHAVVKAASHLGVFRPEEPVYLSRSEEGVIKFQKTAYTNSDILVEPMYDVMNGKAYLVYQATLDMKKNADYWEIRMDANTGEFVSKNNLTIYCKHEKGQFGHHDCSAHNYVNTMAKSKTVESVLSGVPSYRVYPFPAESPSHGSHELVVDPALLVSSPFGWHDVDGEEGAEYTITRGNNVFAYTDKNDDNEPDADVPQPDGGDELVFDFEHFTDMNPIASPDAAQVNLFYANNLIHDIAYTWGFDEVSGNFQQLNYTGEGAGGDFVLAQAFDGFELATPSLNNANFATPPDGSNGRMQMFLWEASSGAVSVDAPSQLEGFYEYGTADYGSPVPGVNDTPVTGRVELVNDGSLTNPTAGCMEIENDLTGKIALIDRGLCFFSEKSYNAQTKGAIGVIICNIVGVNGGDGETVFGMAGADNATDVTIPTVSFKKSDCDAIKLALSNNVDVVVTMHERENSGPDFADGSFDNGIIAHEFGHGISNRLTGGPAASGCLGNAEQMGEGWSDFFTLALTVRPGDDGSEGRGIGTYAIGEGTDGRGIRRFPYSTDMDINPQTYDDLKSSSGVHQIGEIWCTMLWDLYWAFVDVYGYDSDWTNTESGNSIAMRLVMDGMRNQGCNPGFIEGRDGIIAADNALFNGEHNCMIWEVFARRGLGFFAEGGDSDDISDGKENFEPRPTCLEALKITKSATGFIEAGDEIDVILTATNHVPKTLTGVVLTDEIPEGTEYVAGSGSLPGTVSGNIVSFDLGTMEYEDVISISYKIKTPSSQKSASLNFYDFEDGGEGWEVQSLEGVATWSISFDAYKSEESSYRVFEEEAENDHALIAPPFSVTGNKPALKFWHMYQTQGGVDGGFIQVSTDGGSTWEFQDPSKFIRNGYNSVIAYGTLAIPSLSGFTGTTNGNFVDSYLDLSEYQGQDILVRFRYGSDETGITGDPLGGWFVDDVEFIDILTYTAQACVTDDSGEHGACAEPTETIINSDINSSSEDVTFDQFFMQIAPNPASDYIRLSISSKSVAEANVSIMTFDGRVLYSNDLKVGPSEMMHIVNTAGFPDGMYLVKLQSGSDQLTEKLVIH